MNPHIHPGSIVLPPQVLERAADALRAMALDETLKARVGQDALLAQNPADVLKIHATALQAAPQ